MTRVEFDAEKYFGELDIISYEEIVSLLNRTDNKYLIVFKTFEDLENDKVYKFVSVRNMSDHDKTVEYLPPSYDDNDIYENLTNEINNSTLKPEYILDEGIVNTYACFVGRNRVDFPKTVANKLVAELKNEIKYLNELDGKAKVKIK